MGALEALQKNSNVFNLLLSPVINVLDDLYRVFFKRRDHIDIIRRAIHGILVTGSFTTGALLFFFVSDYQDWIRSFIEPLDLPSILEDVSAFYLATNGLAYFSDWAVSLVTHLTMKKTLGDSEYYLTESEKQGLLQNYAILHGESLAEIVINAAIKNCLQNIRSSINKRTVALYKSAFNQLKKGCYVAYALLIRYYTDSQKEDFKKASNTLKATEEVELDELNVDIDEEGSVAAIDLENPAGNINLLAFYTEKAKKIQAKLKDGFYDDDEQILAEKALTQIADGVEICNLKLGVQ